MAPGSLLKGILLNALLVTAGEAGASQKVPVNSSAGAPLFEWETTQLTDHAIAKLNRNQAALVGFGDDTPNTTRSSGTCKTFPGDRQWPSHSTWSTLNNLLDGALIKNVPLAASCYSSWPQYDSNECEKLTAQWTDSNIQ
jgi:hypothetical protein